MARLALGLIVWPALSGCQFESPTLSSFEGICSEVVCRPDHRVDWTDRDFGRDGFPDWGGPYVYRGLIHVMRGERFDIEPLDRFGQLVGLRYAGDPSPSSRFFTVSLEQRGSQTVLEFRNPSLLAVRFQVAIMPRMTGQVIDGHICILMPGETGIFAWGLSLDHIFVDDLAYVAQTTRVGNACRRANS